MTAKGEAAFFQAAACHFPECKDVTLARLSRSWGQVDVNFKDGSLQAALSITLVTVAGTDFSLCLLSAV
jgi:hypothetical protein